MERKDTQSVRIEPLRAKVHEAVLDLILRGRLRPGERVNEMRVADWLGVSRTPLREALIALSREGYLEARPNRGFFVAALDPADGAALYRVLELVEAAAVRDLPAPLPPRVAELGRLDRRLAAAVSPPQALEIDFHWHERLLAGCANRHLVALCSDLRRKVLRYEYACLDPVPDRVGSHAEIVAALSTGDGARASRACERHWGDAARALDAALAAG